MLQSFLQYIFFYSLQFIMHSYEVVPAVYVQSGEAVNKKFETCLSLPVHEISSKINKINHI